MLDHIAEAPLLVLSLTSIDLRVLRRVFQATIDTAHNTSSWIIMTDGKKLDNYVRLIKLNKHFKSEFNHPILKE